MLTLQYNSNRAHSLGDNLVPNVPQIDGPVAQDLARQSPGQLSDPSPLQRSGETMVENFSSFPRLARELERIPQTDLHDLPPSPVERRDLIGQAETKWKEHDFAIRKHLVKKAALVEKLKVWQLDSVVSNKIVKSDECGGNPFQSQLAIEKRIRELKEALKHQDVAIQKHYIRKAALGREMKLWQRNLDREPVQNDVTNHHSLSARLGVPKLITASIINGTSGLQSVHERSYASTKVRCAMTMVAPVAPLPKDSSIPAEVPNYHALDRPIFLNISSDGLAPINDQSLEYSYKRKPSGDQATRMSTVQVLQRTTRTTYGVAAAQRNASRPDPKSHKQRTETAGGDTSSAPPPMRKHPWTFDSVMDKMSQKLERVDINRQARSQI